MDLTSITSQIKPHRFLSIQEAYLSVKNLRLLLHQEQIHKQHFLHFVGILFRNGDVSFSILDKDEGSYTTIKCCFIVHVKGHHLIEIILTSLMSRVADD